MNRSLNLNHFAAKVLLAGLLLWAGMPALLWLVDRLLAILGTHLPLQEVLVSVSMTAGGLLLLGLLLLIILEQVQDALIYRHYQRNVVHRLRISADTFECPYCGCREVHSYQRQCPCCWKVLGDAR